MATYILPASLPIHNYHGCLCNYFLIDFVSEVFIIKVTVKENSFISEIFKEIRDRRQKTFGFLNRLCLLISNPLPPSLTDSLDFSWSNVLILYLYYISLSSSYLHYTYLYIYYLYIYIPILDLFYARILYLFIVLHFNKKIYMVQPPVLHSLCFHRIICMRNSLYRKYFNNSIIS